MSTPVSDLHGLPLGAETVSPPSSPAREPGAGAPGGRRTPAFQMRPGPILVVISLILVFRFLPSLVIDFFSDFVRLPVHGAKLPFYFADHAVMLLMALGLISLARLRSQTDYALHMLRGRSYVATAIVLSALLGIAMAAVDYAPYISRQIAPPLDYAFSGVNVAGWMIYQGLYAGPTEEIPFRALLVTYLAPTMPGVVGYRRLSMNGAGVVVAAIFAFVTAMTAFLASPFLVAFAQVSYGLPFGLFTAYWLA